MNTIEGELLMSGRCFSVMEHPSASSGIFLIVPTIILLIQHFGVQSELICSRQPIVALDGDDVILPCHLQPPISVTSETVVWIKPGLDPNYVHVHYDGQTVTKSQNPSYNFRTKLFVDELKNGNVSLKILKLKLSDAGEYFCIFPSMKTEASIQLTVGAASTPVIEIVSNNSTNVVLHCKSEGWYPEPEVSWLDSEGHVLSAGPTETVRGPDGLYTVSSRVTVEKRDNNNFTCRVQQKNINQTRETQIHVPDDFFMIPSHCASTCIIIIIIIIVVSITVVAVCVYKLKKVDAKMDQKCENEQREEEEEEEEEDGQDDVKKPAFVRKPKFMQRQRAVPNDYEDLPKKRTAKQLQNQREEAVGGSETEEASETGNDAEDKRQTALERVRRQGGIELPGLKSSSD